MDESDAMTCIAWDGVVCDDWVWGSEDEKDRVGIY
jgi:hypothetical protein